MTLANALTISRFFLAILFFILFAFKGTFMRDLALATFVLAGLTDLLDGYFARKRAALSDFGRIADPFVDKILICGAFIFFINQNDPDVKVEAWMVVVIVAREFLVNGLRSFAESRGVPFGATFLGKTKMCVQFATVCWIMVFLAHLSAHGWAEVVTSVMVWLTVIVTAASGVIYAYLAASYGLLRMKKAANA